MLAFTGPLQQRRAAKLPSRLKRCLIVIHFRLGALLCCRKDNEELSGCAVDPGKTFTGDGTSTLNHLAGNDEFFDAFLRGQGIHRVEQEFFKNHYQSTSPNLSL